jgi:hypothetical protein
MRLFIYFMLFAALAYTGQVMANVNYFIGSSAFMLANLNEEDEEPPHFNQFNLGVRLNKNHSISLEWISWRYYSPLGIPYDKRGEKEDNFPGHIRAKGVGIAYQYIFDSSVYTAFHAQWMNQEFRDENNIKLETGKQLFLTARVGYQFKFFRGRIFLEPNLAITHWPTNTKLPNSFREQEEKWPNYFIFEPGLHFGINF